MSAPSDPRRPRVDRAATDLRFRPAMPADCSHLALLADAATRRLVSWLWDAESDAGQSGFEVGRSAILSNEDELSHYSRWRVVERDGCVIGAINSYRLVAVSPSSGTADDVLRPLTELKSVAADTWYVSVASVFPESRGTGVGWALLAEAERIGRMERADRLSLVVASFNPRAKQLYERFGMRESARRAFRPFPGSDAHGDWILMVKDISTPGGAHEIRKHS